MAIFAVTYEYGPDTQRRMDARPAHRTWQSELHAAGTLLASGPLVEDSAPGGLLILQAESRQDIEELLQQDPYAAEQVIERTGIREWDPVFGPWSQ